MHPTIMRTGIEEDVMDYNYSYDLSSGAASGFAAVMWIITLAFAVILVIGLWKTLAKAGLPGWAAIIPFYNEYNVVKMSNRPLWFFWAMLGCSLLAWVPVLNFILVIAIIALWVFIALDIAANFGQGTGFAILLILFPGIMFLILGFGSAEFRRVAAAGSVRFGAPAMPASGDYAAAPAASYGAPPAPPAPPTPPVTTEQASVPTTPVTPATPVDAGGAETPEPPAPPMTPPPPPPLA